MFPCAYLLVLQWGNFCYTCCHYQLYISPYMLTMFFPKTVSKISSGCAFAASYPWQFYYDLVDRQKSHYHCFMLIHQYMQNIRSYIIFNTHTYMKTTNTYSYVCISCITKTPAKQQSKYRCVLFSYARILHEVARGAMKKRRTLPLTTQFNAFRVPHTLP